MALEFGIFFLNLIVFSILFIGIHIADFRCRKPRNVLKATMIDCLAATALGLFLMAVLGGHTLSFAVFSSVVAFILLTAVYAVLVPTMVDRSVSVFLLVVLRNKDTMMLSEQEIISQMDMTDLMKKRFIEHVDAGAITSENGQLKLTPRGKRIADLFIWTQKLLAIEV